MADAIETITRGYKFLYKFCQADIAETKGFGAAAAVREKQGVYDEQEESGI